MKRRHLALTTSLLLLGHGMGAMAQQPLPSSELTLSNGAILLKPSHFDTHHAYALVILLPFTGGRAVTLFNQAFGMMFQAQTTPYVLALLPERSTASDYSTAAAWQATIARYEAQVLKTIQLVQQEGQLQPTSILIGGYSVGGDLSWALLQRQPEVFSGALILASRSTYRGTPQAMKILQNRQPKVFMMMGQNDERLVSIQQAKKHLEQHRIPYQLTVVEGVDHISITDTEAFANSLDQAVTQMVKKLP